MELIEETETITTYICPVCKTKYKNKLDACVCRDKEPDPTPEYYIGDVVDFTGMIYPSGLCVSPAYGIVTWVEYKQPEHKQGLQYLVWPVPRMLTPSYIKAKFMGAKDNIYGKKLMEDIANARNKQGKEHHYVEFNISTGLWDLKIKEEVSKANGIKCFKLIKNETEHNRCRLCELPVDFKESEIRCSGCPSDMYYAQEK